MEVGCPHLHRHLSGLQPVGSLLEGPPIAHSNGNHGGDPHHHQPAVGVGGSEGPLGGSHPFQSGAWHAHLQVGLHLGRPLQQRGQSWSGLRDLQLGYRGQSGLDRPGGWLLKPRLAWLAAPVAASAAASPHGLAAPLACCLQINVNSMNAVMCQITGIRMALARCVTMHRCEDSMWERHECLTSQLE